MLAMGTIGQGHKFPYIWLSPRNLSPNKNKNSGSHVICINRLIRKCIVMARKGQEMKLVVHIEGEAESIFGQEEVCQFWEERLIEVLAKSNVDRAGCEKMA